MTKNELRDAIIEKISEIRRLSGHDPEELRDQTKPLDDLEDFDSLTALEVTTVLCDDLGIDLPADVNLFTTDDGGRALSIEEVVNRAIPLVNQKGGAR